MRWQNQPMQNRKTAHIIRTGTTDDIHRAREIVKVFLLCLYSQPIRDPSVHLRDYHV